MPRRSKDKVYTPFDRLSDMIKDYKPSPEVKKKFESIGRATLKALGRLAAQMIAGKVVNRKTVIKVLSDHSRKVAVEAGREIRKKAKI